MIRSHWRLSSCRNNRAVGYHGVSSRSSSHRQSGMYGSSTQTGRAPTRCATLQYPLEMIRIQVRDQRRGIARNLQISSEVQDVALSLQQLHIRRTHVSLPLTKVASMPSTSGRNDVDGIDRLWSLVWAGRPDQSEADPAAIGRAEPRCPIRGSLCIGAQIRRCGSGGSGSNVVEKASGKLRSGSAGQLPGVHGRATPPPQRLRACWLARARTSRISSRPARRNERRVAAELDRVAKSLLGMEQDGLAGDIGRPQPQRYAKFRRSAFHVGCLQSPFIFAKRFQNRRSTDGTSSHCNVRPENPGSSEIRPPLRSGTVPRGPV